MAIIEATERNIRRAEFAVFAISAATILNSVILQFGRFQDLYIGLCLTQLIDAAAMGLNSMEPPGSSSQFIYSRIALGVDVFITAFLVLVAFGIRKRKTSALLTAVVLYAIDSAAAVVISVLNEIGPVGDRDVRGLLPGPMHLVLMYILVRGLISMKRTGTHVPGLASA